MLPDDWKQNISCGFKWVSAQQMCAADDLDNLVLFDYVASVILSVIQVFFYQL